ncbi:hypothetical protein Tco_0052567 [Tanacetum coccineum]
MTLKRNKHFPEKIDNNLKFPNNHQPEWKRHITIVRQTKDLHEVDYTQVYDFLKMNHEENELIVVPGIANQNANQNGNGNVIAARVEGTGNRNNRNQEEAVIQLQVEEFDLMVAVGDIDKIEEVNANYILMENLQQASTSGTQTDKAPVYDSDGSTELHKYVNCYDNEIFNMFTQEE